MRHSFNSTGQTLASKMLCRVSPNFCEYVLFTDQPDGVVAFLKTLRAPESDCAHRSKHGVVRYCQWCQRTVLPDKKLSRCSRCKVVFYCSSKCQDIHWKTIHKHRCVEWDFPTPLRAVELEASEYEGIKRSRLRAKPWLGCVGEDTIGLDVAKGNCTADWLLAKLFDLAWKMENGIENKIAETLNKWANGKEFKIDKRVHRRVYGEFLVEIEGIGYREFRTNIMEWTIPTKTILVKIFDIMAPKIVPLVAREIAEDHGIDIPASIDVNSTEKVAE